MSQAQFCTAEAILAVVRADPPPADAPSPEAALSELLSSQASYEGFTSVAEYDIDQAFASR